ncbi:hypothetical protein F441_11691 [Phytophthora nicotianae CJ01A1]|uniref:Uncharacterized protein n=1 Tax=Phytophthora nicotianae CJ01A1 TaxID=1317063 RepID=W2WR44_PHYNI|nr:hypothetical protein F441_11691 [Phytophthora nicotianae CJ01A1]
MTRSNPFEPVTGGLKGTNGNNGYSIKDSQVYGRAGWHKDESVLVWIDNPALATPKFSTSKSDTEYLKTTKTYPSEYAGHGVNGPSFGPAYVGGSSTSLRFQYETFWTPPVLVFTELDGDYQELIMWEQLTDAARAALNSSDNFGRAEGNVLLQ